MIDRSNSYVIKAKLYSSNVFLKKKFINQKLKIIDLSRVFWKDRVINFGLPSCDLKTPLKCIHLYIFLAQKYIPNLSYILIFSISLCSNKEF